jgi:DNA-binding protein YbaB
VTTIKDIISEAVYEAIVIYENTTTKGDVEELDDLLQDRINEAISDIRDLYERTLE